MIVEHRFKRLQDGLLSSGSSSSELSLLLILSHNSSPCFIGFIFFVLINNLRSEDVELSDDVELLEEKNEPPVELATFTLFAL